jgi:Mn-dependent DtxR family transcriptional regulator
MPRKRDDESGQYTERYPLDAFTDALRAEGGQAGTGDISRRVGCSDRLALTRLRELADEGAINHRRVANAHLWILAEDKDEERDSDE